MLRRFVRTGLEASQANVITWHNLWQRDLLFDGETVTLSLESLADGELPATVTGRLAR